VSRFILGESWDWHLGRLQLFWQTQIIQSLSDLTVRNKAKRLRISEMRSSLKRSLTHFLIQAQTT
jgi:hypothetical protein